MAKLKLKEFLRYLILFLLTALSIADARACFARENNFYDYAREERRRELIEQAGSGGAENGEELIKANKKRLLYGQLFSVLLSALGLGIIIYTKKKYTSPYSVNGNVAVSGKDLEDFIFSLRPLEISAVININEFTKYDLIAAILDLTRRGFFYLQNEEPGDNTLCVNEEIFTEKRNEIEDYEDFLVGWLFRKVGGGGRFNSDELESYVSIDSRAVDFDIDYDVWLDELNEYVSGRGIADELTESWKLFCAVFGVVYAALGMVLLYVTSSVTSLLLFSITLLSHLASYKAVRRSKTAEEIYSVIAAFKNHMNNELLNMESGGNTQKREAYFVYSIPIESMELTLKEDNAYARLFFALETKLDNAIKYSSGIAGSVIR